ncbi:MAG: DNA polymerase III subunit delta' [Pseudomonadota bacterium]
MSAAEESPGPEADRIPGHPHPREAAALHGQEAAEGAFLAARRGGRLHHAWLLRGPAGIGKATLAYRIARSLIAEGPADETAPAGLFGPAPVPAPESLDAPADCPVARRIRAGSEPGLAVLRRSVNPNTGRLRTQIGVDEVRQIRGFLSLSAPDGGWRAIIVDSADEMTVQAANALLKSLEEPPARTAFLLVSHAPGRLLPTIRSRCRALDLAPLSPGPLAAALAGAGSAVDPAEAPGLAALSQGSVGAALRLVAEDGLALYAELCALLAPARGMDRAALASLAGKAAARGAEARYALTLDLAVILAARLARAGAGHPPPPATPEEPRLAAGIAAHPAQARLWAEASGRIAAAAAHARAVSLDPAQTVMDTFLGLDETRAAARALA